MVKIARKSNNLLNFEDLMNAPSRKLPGSNLTFDHVLTMSVEGGVYTLSSTGSGSTSGSANTNRCLYFASSDADACVFSGHPVSKSTQGTITIAFMSSRDNAQQYISGDAVIMLNEGPSPLPYEPPGTIWEDGASKRYHISKNKFDESTAGVISTLGGSRYGVDMGAVAVGSYTLSFDIEPNVILYLDHGTQRMMFRGGSSTDVSHMSIPLTINYAFDLKIYTESDTATTFESEGVTNIMFNEGSELPYEPYGSWWEDCTESLRRNGVWVPQS